jgi:hypothetical protein
MPRAQLPRSRRLLFACSILGKSWTVTRIFCEERSMAAERDRRTAILAAEGEKQAQILTA